MRHKAKLAIPLLVAFALVLVPVVAFAWNGGVDKEVSCEGVTVTADPQNINDGLFFVWKPVSVEGTGFFPWNGESSLSGTVTVTWGKFGKFTGHDYGNRHSEDFYWSADKPDCEEYWGEADCEGWVIWGQILPGEPFVASSGSWVNPFVLESAEDYDVTVYEPEYCLQEPGEPYTDCTGVWFFNVELKDYELVYEWTNPANQESVVIDEVTYWEPRECIEKQCESESLGWLFHLVGPDGQTCDLASYQRNPNTGRWAIPNVEAQQQCCGFVAENIPSGREIVKECNGKVNVICTRCMGGGPDIAYGD